LSKNQWLGGAMPSSADKDAIAFFMTNAPKPASQPHTYNWFSLVTKFKDEKKNAWPVEKKAAAEDDEMDLFGSDDEDDEASFDALCKAKQAAIDKANSKKKAIAKSIVMFEVKPLESETDLDVLFARILKECQRDGCDWKQDCKKEPVAFGVFKLIVGCVIEDDKVSTDDIEEQICAMEDMV
jgi:elongation factor 1-beta